MTSVVALILAGGYATRLRPLSYTRPKPLLKIVDKPILDYIIDSVLKVNPDLIILSLRYLADKIIDHVRKTWNKISDKIIFMMESKPLGDAGPIARAVREYGISESSILVVNSDIYSNIDFTSVIESHRRSGSIATLVLTRLRGDLSRFGVASIDDDLRVTHFVEKPQRPPSEGLVNAGVYVFEPEISKYLPHDVARPLKISTYLLPKLIEERTLHAYIHEGYWLDVGTPEDYIKANRIALEQMCRDESCIKGDVLGGVIPPSYISATAQVGRNSMIGPYTVILDECKIGSGVRIKNSIVLDKTIIEEYTYITGSIIGENAYIGRWVRIEDNCIVGDYTYIESEVYIARGVKIGPHREITDSIRRENEVLP